MKKHYEGGEGFLQVSFHNYLKVTKFSDTLHLAILDFTKLVHTKFSDSINLSFQCNQLAMHLQV